MSGKLPLYNCYKIDTVWARAQNFKIEKTCGRELLTAGLSVGYEKDFFAFFVGRVERLYMV